MYKILSTKNLEPALLPLAKEGGMDITEQEFISVRPIRSPGKRDEVLPRITRSTPAAAVFTSAHAVEAVATWLHEGNALYAPNWKVYCLSGKTRESLSNGPLSAASIAGTAGNAAALARLIADRGEKEVIFFCGNQRRDDLPQILKEAGIAVDEVVVYETTELPAPAVNDFDGIFFFSPSGVRSFFSVNKLPPQTVCFAIGPTTAAAIAAFTDNKLVVSEAPSQEMMIACARFYFQNINTPK